jgi:DNA-binding MarR family transcriptional regulator
MEDWMKIKDYLSKVPRKGRERGQSPNWAAIQKLLEERPWGTGELSKALGWSYTKTSMVLHRMRQAGFVERSDKWSLKR